MMRNHGIFGSAGQDGFSSPGGTACNTVILVDVAFSKTTAFPNPTGKSLEHTNRLLGSTHERIKVRQH